MHISMSFGRIMVEPLTSSSQTSHLMSATILTSPQTSSTSASAVSAKRSSHLYQRPNGSNRSTFITMRKFRYKHFYWILISLHIFIASAYCDDVATTIPQKRSGGPGGGGGNSGGGGKN